MALLTINDIMNKHIEEDTEVLTLNIEKRYKRALRSPPPLAVQPGR